ncbi:hypothetical protein EOD42_13905 [Rhodovarius crocodyli]|uniref:Uncharacterized protein n=1 Tax=Rhodovarius crocodyli TaxID=1979269 RepID=A0A437MF14_9PROT|nr:hypothetical protein [Rhodovarius crocodyli]RVT96206.1 hypothetical protein EOD42_13905 [Rhodovarius crocodyli]
MNRRILKKQCKRAMEVLIQHHGYRASSFKAATGDECIVVLAKGFDRRQLDDGRPEPDWAWLHPGPLKGTPLFYRQVNHEHDEWDHKLPTEELADITTDWSGFLAPAGSEAA